MALQSSHPFSAPQGGGCLPRGGSSEVIMHAATEAPPPVINPTAEDAYWRHAFKGEPYYKAELNYEDYSPAYRVGYTGPLRRQGDFHSLEAALHQDWDQVKGRSRLGWDEARLATRAAWDRVARWQ
jgi:hypothetical protein